MSKIVIATACLESKGDPELMLAALECLSRKGYDVCVTDGGSSPAFREQIAAMGHDLRISRNGLRGQLESSLIRAGEKGTHVMYCECDKLEFLETRLEETLDRYWHSEFDYAPIGRDAQAYGSFPFVQQSIEACQNRLMSHELQIQGDWVAGPAIMPAAHTLQLHFSRWYGTAQHGWGIPWYLLARAHRENLKIGVIDTACGVHGTATDEFIPSYRLSQANQMLGCFYEGLGKHYDWADKAAGSPLPLANEERSVVAA
jgi:hypothetical protein